MAGRVLVAKVSFSYVDEDGATHLVPVGIRVREGHPMTVGREQLFTADDPIIEWEAPKPEKKAPESDDHTEHVHYAPEEAESEAVKAAPVKRGPGRPAKSAE